MIYLKDSTENISSMVLSTPSGGIIKGEVATINDAYGFAINTASDDVDNVNYASKYVAVTYARQAYGVKATGSGAATFAAGDKVYYDTVAKQVTDTSSGNIFIGYAKAAAGTSDDEVLIEFDGRPKS